MKAVLVTVVMTAACAGSPSSISTQIVDPLAEVSGQKLYDEAARFEQAGDLIRAEQYYAASVRRGASPERAVIAMVRVCVAGSRFRAALAHARRYVADNPDSWRGRYLLAALYQTLGDSDSARRQLDEIARRHPEADLPRALQQRGSK